MKTQALTDILVLTKTKPTTWTTSHPSVNFDRQILLELSLKDYKALVLTEMPITSKTNNLNRSSFLQCTNPANLKGCRNIL